MSDEGRHYVKRYSPFTGTTFWVHYVLGDISNKDNGYELWGSDEGLAAEWPISKRAVERARSELLAGGFLSVVQEKVRGRSMRYRFEFPEVAPNTRQSGGSSSPAKTVQTTRQSGGDNPPKHDPVLLVTEEELKGTEIVGDNFPFEPFWTTYPKRHGKRLYKPEAMKQWVKLSDADKSLAMVGVKYYREACDTGDFIAKDSFRWLRDHHFMDWQEPPEAGASSRGPNRKPGGGPDTSVLWRRAEGDIRGSS